MRIPVFAETKATQTGRHPGRVLRRLLSKREAAPFPATTLCDASADKKCPRIQKDTRTKRLSWQPLPCLLFKCGRCSRFPLRPEPDSRRGPGSIAECHRSRGSKTSVSYHAPTISVNRVKRQGRSLQLREAAGTVLAVAAKAETIGPSLSVSPPFPLIEAEPELCYNTLHDTSHLSHRLVSL